MYSTDLTDAQWEIIKPLFAGIWSKRTLVNAVLYINRTGCQWRNLPNDFPPYKTVFSFYSRACKKGLWDELLVLLVDETRKGAGRKPSPTYGIVASRSVKTVYHSSCRGVDGGKKSKDVNAI